MNMPMMVETFSTPVAMKPAVLQATTSANDAATGIEISAMRMIFCPIFPMQRSKKKSRAILHCDSLGRVPSAQTSRRRRLQGDAFKSTPTENFFAPVDYGRARTTNGNSGGIRDALYVPGIPG